MEDDRPINTILCESSQMPRHTELRRVFAAFWELVREYNWLFSGDESLARKGWPWWIEGDELTRRLEVEPFRFNWVVVSGFRRGLEVDLGAKSLPWVHGNQTFWGPTAAPQHPMSSVEVVGIDGSMTLVLSREPEFARRFRAAFADAEDLDVYNYRHGRHSVRARDAPGAFRVGDEVVLPVVRVGQATGEVQVVPTVHATLHVKQMRAVGFGPVHWFTLDEYLKAGQRVGVRIASIDVTGIRLMVEV